MGVPRLKVLLGAALLGACAADGGGVAVATAELRPDDPDARELPDSFPADVTVETIDGERGAVRVHFTRQGQHAIPLEDADGDDVPDYAREVAREYEASLAFYASELGLIPPVADDAVAGNNGGDAKLDVYLVDFPTGADGAFRADQCLEGEPQRCAGHMVHENDFDRRAYPSLTIANRTIASHELFHAIQHAYDATAGVVLAEGTAVWASETYAPELDDFELLIGGYFERPERSLAQEPTGPVDTFSYGSAIFFRFLEERFGREVIAQLWQRLGAAPGDAGWLAALEAVLSGQHASSLAEAYADFVRWNLYTGSRADTEQAYARGASYPELNEREVALPHFDDRVRVFPLAARHLVADVEQAGDVYLEVSENEASLTGLELVLAVESGGAITALEHGRVERASEVTVRVERGERVHAALLNTMLEGESLQPRVCLARAGDDAPCGNAPVPADAAVDSGEPEPGDVDAPASESSGGCATAAPGSDRSMVTSLALAVGLLILRRFPASSCSHARRSTADAADAGEPARRAGVRGRRCG